MNEGARAVPRARPVEACPACGARRSRPSFSGPDALHATPGWFHYRTCRGCGTVFQDPRVIDEDLGLLYPDTYYTHTAPTGGGRGQPSSRTGAGVRDRVRSLVRGAVAPGAGRGSGTWTARVLATSRWVRERAFNDHVLDELLPWSTPPGRVLDVGCGSGRLMAALAEVGWCVEGAEVDARAAAVARHATGAPVHMASAESLPVGLGPFDLVVMSHVLEHLPHPIAALARLERLLAPGGRLVVIYPNPESLMARWFGPDWYHWDPPRHVVLPPLAALRGAGSMAGLRLRGARTLPRWASDTWRQSWMRRREATGRGSGASTPAMAGLTQIGVSLVERMLTHLGLPVGEEVVGVFERRTVMGHAGRRGTP